MWKAGKCHLFPQFCTVSQELDRIAKEIEAFQIKSAQDLETFRNRFLVKKSELNEWFGKIKDVSAEERKQFGQWLNGLKNKATEKFETFQAQFGASDLVIPVVLDDSLPVYFPEVGSLHPLTIIRDEITQVFQRLGFGLETGPEIEDDWHNFSALNFPPDHPARDMQDTFFIDADVSFALRTHTSSVQVRLLEKRKPPVRSIMPGRVYRNEAVSARANCFFHQVEGIYIDKKVSFADLKGTLYAFVRQLFGEETNVRFRPSYFPFTEPSAEMDISCQLCGGSGCSVCKKTGWVEILGCGMVDPTVLTNAGIDPDEYSGFAFGMGIERIAMLKYEVNDLRLFFDNDLRFTGQFRQ